MRKRFAEGKVTMTYKQLMGYRRGKNGVSEVVEVEARIIRTLFKRFLEGATPSCRRPTARITSREPSW